MFDVKSERNGCWLDFDEAFEDEMVEEEAKAYAKRDGTIVVKISGDGLTDKNAHKKKHKRSRIWDFVSRLSRRRMEKTFPIARIQGVSSYR